MNASARVLLAPRMLILICAGFLHSLLCSGSKNASKSLNKQMSRSELVEW
jgi:hypothetical protein